MLVIELLGTLSLRAETGTVPLVAQQKRPLALLALLALGGKQGLSRQRIESYLWPDSDADHAGHALNQAVYAIRQSLGDDVILSTAQDLRLNEQLIGADVWFFDEAIAAKDWARAASIYRGTLLDGVHFGDSRELESLIDANRTRLRQDYHKALEFLANVSAEAGDRSQSVTWWRKLVNSDPLSAHATRKLMLALAAARDRAGALTQARLYQELVRQELEMEPDSQVEALALTLAATTGETAGPGAREEASHTRLVFTEHSAETAPKLLYTVTALAVLISAAAIWGWMRPAPPEPEEVQYAMMIDPTEAMVPSTPWSGRIAISLDGSLLAYIGGPRSQLLIRPRRQLHAIAVPGTEGAASPFFSRDGKQVGFLREGIVQIASVSGGPPITVSDSLTGVSGASWGPDNFIYADGSILFMAVGLVRVEAKPGAVPRWFTTLDTAGREVDHLWPDVLPNGKGVLFTVGFIGRNGVKGGASYAIAVADIPSGKHRVILENAMYARYAEPGYLLYVTTNKSLMVVPFDQNSMKIAGEPTPLTEGVRLGLLGSADLGVSAKGTLIYTTGAGEGRQELVWVTRDGKEQAVDPAWTALYLGVPTLSPDGKSIAETKIDDAESPSNIWIKHLDRSPGIKLTVGTKENFQPAWTPDGKSVTFSSRSAKGTIDLWTQRADGSAQAVLQLQEKGALWTARWSPDRKWLIFSTDIASPGAGDILAIRPGIDTAPVPVAATRFTELSPALSHNGRWLAYVSNETGKDEIYVVPFPNKGTAKWAISTGGGTEPAWSHRGNELFYRDASGNFVAVAVKTKPTFSVGLATALFPAAKFTSLRFNTQYAVAPDDRRFLMIRPQETATPDKLIVVENWFEELKRRGDGPAR